MRISEYTTEYNRYFWIYLTLAFVAMFILAISVVAILEITDPFDNYLSSAPSSDNKLINLMEIVYFLANSFVAVVAVIALLFAREQFRQSRAQTKILIQQTSHTERARLAPIYLQISQKWDSVDIAAARDTIDKLVIFYEGNRERMPDILDVRVYLDKILSLKRGENFYSAFENIINYIEDIGLLCRNHYVRIEDVVDIIGSGLRYYIDLFSTHIYSRRNAMPNQRQREARYANSLWLQKQLLEIVDHHPYRYGE